MLQYGDEDEHARVRGEVCDFIESNNMVEEFAKQVHFLRGELIENGLVKQDATGKVYYDAHGQPVLDKDKCLADGVWGTALTLLAAQRMYNVDIYMRVHDQHWQCFGGANAAHKRFFIEYKLGMHYQAWKPPR